LFRKFESHKHKNDLNLALKAMGETVPHY
jgi:hypothetical protein